MWNVFFLAQVDERLACVGRVIRAEATAHPRFKPISPRQVIAETAIHPTSNIVNNTVDAINIINPH
jgi:hypothetical protein